jgi:hypothetical protein
MPVLPPAAFVPATLVAPLVPTLPLVPVLPLVPTAEPPEPDALVNGFPPVSGSEEQP